MLTVVAGEEAVDVCAAHGEHAHRGMDDTGVPPQDTVAGDDAPLAADPAAIGVALGDGQIQLESRQPLGQLAGRRL